MRPILCYLFHAWQYDQNQSLYYLAAAHCARCGARKEWSRNKRRASRKRK